VECELCIPLRVMLQAIADVHIDLAMKLADVLKQVWAEADRWNDDEKRAIAALSNPIDGTLNSLDRLSVILLIMLLFF